MIEKSFWTAIALNEGFTIAAESVESKLDAISGLAYPKLLY